MAVLLSSCMKEAPQQYQYNATFYVGGNVAKDAAYIYKDKDVLYRLDDNASLSGLAVMQDGIYSCGEIWNWDSKPMPTTIPAIWKDGKKLDVDFGGIAGKLHNMVNRGENWLCCGTITDEDGNDFGIVVENGKVVYRSADKVLDFDYIDVDVYGDYYVLATDYEGVKILHIDGESKQLVSSDTIAANEGYDAWYGGCMFVGLRDIAVGMSKFNLQDGKERTYIWLSGYRELVELQENSSVESLCFFNGYCLAGGCLLTESGESGSATSSKAVQWVVNNGFMQDFSYGCVGKSDLRLMMNYGDMFLFQGVQHDGGLQICNDGMLMADIKTPAGFNANCWDVTIERIPLQ